MLDSGLARTLGRSAFARPQAARRVFEPLKRHALPAIASRFASTDSAKVGKIHQVIGAVVDGMKNPYNFYMELSSNFLCHFEAPAHLEAALTD